MTNRNWIACGAALAAVDVAIGAMGAHALRDRLTDAQKVTYETAVRYQMYHSLGLILWGLLAPRCQFCCDAGYYFLAGILLFSGGLYAWIFTSQPFFVAVVPVGGTLWIVGWVMFAIKAWTAAASADTDYK